MFIFWYAPYKAILFIALGVLVFTAILLHREYCLIISILLSLTILTVSLLTYTNYNHIENGKVTGEVTSVGENVLTLTNVNITSDSESIKCKHCYLYSSAEYSVGDIVSLTGECTPLSEYYNSSQNPGDISSGFTYQAEKVCYGIYSDDISLVSHKKDIYTFFDSLRAKIYSRMSLIIKDEDTLNSLYTMLTGDKSHIDDLLSELYSSVGVSHLLAVSGFHVSVLLGLLSCLLSALKIKRRWKFLPIALFLTFYLFLTGFTPSVIRAGFMALVVVIAPNLGVRYDPLNILSLAGTVILLISPFQVFNISFQLSFCACFGIISFHKDFKGFFGKILSSALITISATVTTLPVILYYFGSASVISVLSNLIIVPLTSVGIMLAVAVIIPVMLCRYLLPLLFPSYLFCFATVKLIIFFSYIPVAVFPINAGIYAIVILGFIVFFSKFIHIKPKFKAVVASVLILVLSVISVYAVTDNERSATIRVLYNQDSNLSVHIHQNNDYLIGYGDSYAERKYVLRNLSNVDGLILLSNQDIDGYKAIGNKMDFIKNVYSTSGYDFSPYPFTSYTVTDNKTVMDKSTFILSEQGLIYSFSGKKVFIGANDQTSECEEKVDINISKYYPIDNCINITSCENENFTYSSLKQGCITIKIEKNGITITPYHEVKK